MSARWIIWKNAVGFAEGFADWNRFKNRRDAREDKRTQDRGWRAASRYAANVTQRALDDRAMRLEVR